MDPLAPFSPTLRSRWRPVTQVEGGTVATLWRVEAADGGVACAKVVPGDGDGRTAMRFDVERDATRRLPRRDDVARLLEAHAAPDGTGLLLLRWEHGENLRRRLGRTGGGTAKEAVAWMAKLLSALEAVHATGLVHCDVKPENLVVDGEGPDARLVLIDFGLATPAGGTCTAAGGATAGTPRYMAPEQVRGEPVGPWTDVYAAACVAYELLTGEPPFTGSASADVRTQQLQSRPVPPGIVSAAGDVTDALDAAVLKALAKAPADRFADVASFRQALVDAAG